MAQRNEMPRARHARTVAGQRDQRGGAKQSAALLSSKDPFRGEVEEGRSRASRREGNRLAETAQDGRRHGCQGRSVSRAAESAQGSAGFASARRGDVAWKFSPPSPCR